MFAFGYSNGGQMAFRLAVEQPRLAKIQVTAKITLLAQGDTSTKMFIIHQGCIRACFNKDGTSITAQFFVGDEVATAFESFMNRTPSQYSLECIEPCELSLLTKTDFDHFLSTDNPLHLVCGHPL